MLSGCGIFTSSSTLEGAVYGRLRNDITINIKGGATCNINKQLHQASSLVKKLIQILPQCSFKATDPVLNAPSSVMQNE